MFSLLRCLLLPSPSIFVACAVEFQVGVLRSREFFGVKSSPARIDNSAFLCLMFCLHERNGLWFTDSNNVLQKTKTQLLMSALVIDGNLKLLSVECCLETKMRRDVNYCMTSWRTPSDICNSSILIGLAVMVYELLYHALHIWSCTRQFKIGS